MIRDLGPFAILTLRIALSTWFLLVASSALCGIVVDVASRGDMDVGVPGAFLAALIVFPPMALCWGLWCAWWQRRALVALGEGSGLLSVGCRRSIHLELGAEQALRLAESAVRAVFVVSRLQTSVLGLSARVFSVTRTNALWSWRFEDRLRMTVDAPDGERCVLRISLDPVHAWIYGLFAVDNGRCVQEMRSIESALQERVRAQYAIVDDFRRRESTRARTSEAQLAMLRAHVEPHFIYNTLAHVRASLGPQSETASAMLDALVEFLRRNTHALNGEETTIRDELAMVERYLRIIALRLEERLRYDFECPPALLDRRVPAACLLVLVENAVKHGIERCVDGGRIDVRCALYDDGDLRLSVTNDGPPFETIGGRRGGLSNLQERIKLIHGASQPLEIENRETGGTLVTITLPSRHGGAA